MNINLFPDVQQRGLRSLTCSWSLRTKILIATVALSSVCASSAVAACASPAQRMPASVLSGQMLSLPQESASDSMLEKESRSGEKAPSITGLWKTVYIADGAVFNVGFNIWHSDGTEWALDSVSPPFQGNTCAGVWEQVGRRTYKTIHPAFNYDSAGLSVTGVFIERVEVTLSHDGNSFHGTFSFENYDFEGNPTGGNVTGTLTATRIKVGDQTVKVPLK